MEKTELAEGDLVCLQPGQNTPKSGTILFRAADEVEIMRFETNGDCYVRGQLVDNNETVYKEFRAWLEAVEAFQNPMLTNHRLVEADKILRMFGDGGVFKDEAYDALRIYCSTYSPLTEAK